MANEMQALQGLVDLGRSILLAEEIRNATACRRAQAVQAQLLELTQETLELTAAEWAALTPTFVGGDDGCDEALQRLVPPFVELHYGEYRCFVQIPHPVISGDDEGCQVDGLLTLHSSWDTDVRLCCRAELALWLVECQDLDASGTRWADDWDDASYPPTWGEELLGDLETAQQALDDGDVALSQARSLAIIAAALVRMGCADAL